MSSQLLERDNQYGIVMGWHKLTKVRELLKRDECFPNFQRKPLMVPYTVEGETHYRPLVVDGNEWFTVQADDDELNGIPVPQSYRVFTPREAWDRVSQILAGSRYTVASAGTLANRSKWFISCELDELKEACAGMTGDNAHRFSFNFWGGMDRSLSPVCNLSATRIVCDNTRRVNQDDKASHLFTARLSSSFDEKIEAAIPEVEKAVGMIAVYKATMERLGNQKATVDDARNAYAGFLVSKGGSLRSDGVNKDGTKRTTKTANTVEELTNLFQRGIGNKGESRLDILNGFTQLYTRGNDESKKDKWSQFEASEFGLYADRKEEFGNVLAMAPRFARMVSAGKDALAMAN